MTATVQIFPWITSNHQISAIMSNTDLMFSTNEISRQRYICWRLWSLQKSTTKSLSRYDIVRPKFYLEDNEEDGYSEDEGYSDKQNYNLPNSFENDNDNDNMMLLSHMTHYNQQEGEEYKEGQLHHCPSYFNNLNLCMLNN